jgi:opacity protein-like surface antigen
MKSLQESFMPSQHHLARSGLAALAACAFAAAARADGASGADAAQTLAPAPSTFASGPAASPSSAGYAPAADALPTFAQAPSNPSSPWTGLTLGGGISVMGGKGVKGGVGGDAFLGYNKELSNGIVIGVQGVSGYTPSMFSKYSRVNGFDYAGANVTVGYDMGRFEPYVIAGVGFAKANFGPPGLYNSSQSLNDLFNKSSFGGPLATITTVGAGFNYAVTNNLSMGLSFTATQVNGGPAAPYLP